MDIITLYKNRMTSDFIIRNLFNGILPTAGEISDYIRDLDLSQLPLVDQFTTEFTGQASSASYNEMLERVGIDLNVVYDAIQQVAAENMQLSNYTLSKLEGYSNRLKELNTRAENLVLTQQNAEGYVDFFYDDFSTIDNVDFTVTDAFVDVDSTEVRVSNRVTDDLVKIDPTTVSFGIKASPNIYSSGEMPGMEIGNLVDFTAKPWQFRVVTRQPVDKVEGTIIFRFDRSIRGLHRIELSDSSSDSSQAAGFEYSLDGLNYTPFNTASPFTAVGPRTTVEFDVVDDVTHVRIPLQKRSYSYFDRYGRPVYIFSLDEIRMYASGTITLPGSSIYQSNDIEVTGKVITKCSLEVCHSIPEGAAINYYVANSGLSATTFIPISASNESNQQFPTVIDFGQNSELNFNPLTYYTTNPTFENNNSNIQYSVVQNSDFNSVDKNYLYLWKNVLNQSDYSGSGTITNGNGWLTDGSVYKCFFFVDEREGIKLDFKNTVATLDGIQVTGQKFVKYGVHSFETSATNWANLTAAGTDPIPGTALNHKYLIEGVVANTTISTNLGYKNRSVPRFIAGRRAIYVPKYDFFYGNLNNKYDIFTVVNTSAGYRIITNNDDDTSNDGVSTSGTNQAVLVEYKSGSGASTTSAETVCIRAVLTANSDGATPSIDSVLLKLGTVTKEA